MLYILRKRVKVGDVGQSGIQRNIANDPDSIERRTLKKSVNVNGAITKNIAQNGVSMIRTTDLNAMRFMPPIALLKKTHQRVT